MITRFNPSATGALHLGHIYTLLVNERLAHQQGGKCYVRFDDTSQGITICMTADEQKRIPAIIDNMKMDIEWLGINIDDWIVQSEIQQYVKLTLGLKLPNLYLADIYPPRMPYSIRMGAAWQPYPYAPYQTAERVVMDYDLGVTHLIRGDDFFCEYSLYAFFCDIFHFPFPEYILLPRLVNKLGNNISKTNGGYTIAELREDGYTAQDIIGLIERACLIWSANGWSLYNLKKEPRLEI